ncbi:MAG: LTA synthase family protein [Clostridium butyricum]|nr:LTA synthase family protein [Clostridium butyricum]
MSLLNSKSKNFFTKDSLIRLLFFIIPLISIVLKGIFYQGFITSGTPYSFNFTSGYYEISSLSLSYYFAFAFIFLSFSFLFKSKGRLIYIFTIDIIVTALFIFDVWYYRGFNTVPSLLVLNQTSNLDNMTDAILSMISPMDWIFFIDFVILGILAYIFRSSFAINKNFKRAIRSFLLTFILPFVYVAYLPFNLYVLHNPNVKNAYILAATDPNYTYEYLSAIGYHIHDAVMTYINTQPYTLTESDKENLKNYYAAKNENLPDNEYFGSAKGKNLIYIQVESLENFVIDKTINGKEITPVLNKLTQSSVYFPNIFEQVNEGTSSDCDFIVNTSLFPVRRGTAFFRYPNNNYNSMPKILSNNGYYTEAIHPDKGSFWNYQIALSGGIGFDKFTDYYSFEHDESIGMGLSDRRFFEQAVPKIGNMKSPFYAMTVTLTSHGPFNLPEKYRELELEQELNDNKLGGYFESIHYTDKQIGHFLELLKEEGILDNSIIVIMGDHTGVHKYYNDDIDQLSSKEDWYLDNGGRMVPVLIYDPSGSVKPKTFESLYGGQVDLMPTLLYLLGIPADQYQNTCMGRNLLNTNKSFAVINNGKIYGEENLTDKEKEIFSKTLDISDKIIRANYNYDGN